MSKGFRSLVNLRKKFATFLLPFYNQGFCCARQHLTGNYWFAVWFRFRGQMCLGWLGHILLASLANDSPDCKSFAHICAYLSLWTSFLSNEHQLNEDMLKIDCNNLNDILNVSTTQDLTPHSDALVKSYRSKLNIG